jgi:hypothetical protein
MSLPKTVVRDKQREMERERKRKKKNLKILPTEFTKKERVR